MGFEWNQNAKDLGALYLVNVGRQYKKPGTTLVWSYSEQSLENTYKNDRGQFFRTWDFSSNEISQQTINGYVLNRIYFHIASSGSGSGGTGSPPETAVQIYNPQAGLGQWFSID